METVSGSEADESKTWTFPLNEITKKSQNAQKYGIKVCDLCGSTDKNTILI